MMDRSNPGSGGQKIGNKTRPENDAWPKVSNKRRPGRDSGAEVRHVLQSF
jgi:hypothetical protein